MGLVLIQGSEVLLADRAIANIISSNSTAHVLNLDAQEIELGVITDALAPSLFGDKRIVVIKEIQELVAECSEEILEYLHNQDDNLILVIWHKGGVKGKGLIDKFRK